jgi:multidrug efflux pump subunit AcrA (membrane-fusion protein)
MKRLAIILVLLTVVSTAGILLDWLHLFRGNDPKAAPATATVSHRDFASSVLATGAVKPQVGSEVRVGARISGRVERLYANVGDVVKKGQTIAELEKADLEATAAQREAELRLAEAKLQAIQALGPREIEKAEADVAQWQATATLTRKDLERETHLLKQSISSQATLDEAQEKLSVAEAHVASCQKTLELARSQFDENLKQACADVERAKAARDFGRVGLSYATIQSPIGGVIASVSTQEGETVAAGLSAPTFVTIINLDRLQVDAFVDEVDIGKILVGQKAVFTVESFPGKEFEGKVAAIYPKAVVQENVVYYDVVIEVTSPYSGFLRPEMTASVTLYQEQRPGVLAIPSKAVKRWGGKTVVYMPTAGGAEAREVKVGWKDGSYLEIVSGLREGETVLLEAPDSANGETVK